MKILKEKTLNITDYKYSFDRYMLTLKYTFICFLLVHGAFFVSRFVNEDYLHDEFKSGTVALSGRFLPTFTDVMNPWLIGIISAIIFSFSVHMVYQIFDVKNKLLKFLVAFLMISFPALSHGFAYLFMVQVYSLALFLAILAVWTTLRFKLGFLLGGICLMLSLGAYQSYIGVSISLSLFIIIDMWYKGKGDKILATTLRLMVMGVLGIAFYMIIIKLVYPMLSLELNNYKGISSMGVIALSDVPRLLFRTYANTLRFMLGMKFFHVGWMHISANVLLALLLAVSFIKKAFEYKFKRYTLLAVLAVLVLPMGLDIVDLISPMAVATTLNTYAFVFVYVFFAVHFINFSVFDLKNILKSTLIRRAVATALIIIVIVSNIAMSATYYLKVSTVYEATFMFENRLLARMEMVEGYDRTMPIAIIASVDCEYLKGGVVFKDVKEDPALWTKYVGLNSLAGKRISYATDRTVRLMNNMLNVGVVGASPAKIDEIVASDEYRAMGVYPASDSIRIIDGVLTVNFDKSSVE